MPRRAFPFVPDAHYHFYNRGNNRQVVFFESANYLFFLLGMEKYLAPALELLAYCLMPSHYHILARVRPPTSEVAPTSEVSRAMQRFLISYTKSINCRYSRVGALFQGQFQAKLIESDEHLRRVCMYIHANPVRDELVTSPEDWEYSNYLEWIAGHRTRQAQDALIGEVFGSGQAYRAQVTEYLRDFRSRPTSEV
jgi:putative transposase